MKRSKLNKKSKSEVALCKDRIQALLRMAVMIRDQGCILRHYEEEAGQCGGIRNDGQLILQAEHLNTRERNISYGDLRNIVCLCKRHHGYFKPQYGLIYWQLIERHLGPIDWKWLKRVMADKKTYHMVLWDWLKVELGLIEDIKKLKLQYGDLDS